MYITVYNEAGFDLDPVERQLLDHGLRLRVHGPLQERVEDEAWHEWLAWYLAWSKVRKPDRPIPEDLEPMPLEVDRELAALRGESKAPGPLYDGIRLVESFHGPLPEEERSFGAGPVVVLTDRLVGTFEGTRYHVRFLVGGHPCIVSPPGFVDGPARQREYYLAKQVKGIDPSEVVGDDHVGPKDPRLGTCLASALLQVAAYHDRGEAFCQDSSCRLFNPHWQADLLESMATQDLCDQHRAWLDELA